MADDFGECVKLRIGHVAVGRRHDDHRVDQRAVVVEHANLLLVDRDHRPKPGRACQAALAVPRNSGCSPRRDRALGERHGRAGGLEHHRGERPRAAATAERGLEDDEDPRDRLLRRTSSAPCSPACHGAAAQPSDLIRIVRAAENRPAGAMQNVRAGPGHAVEHDQTQRAAGDVDAVADRIGAEQAGILFRAKDVDQGRCRHRLHMLGEEQEAPRFKGRGNALMHQAQPGDRGETSPSAPPPAAPTNSDAAWVTCETCWPMSSRGTSVTTRTHGRSRPGGQERLETRCAQRAARTLRQVPQSGCGLGSAPGEFRVGGAVGQRRRGDDQPVRQARNLFASEGIYPRSTSCG